jgi:hypothetical protein
MDVIAPVAPHASVLQEISAHLITGRSCAEDLRRSEMNLGHGTPRYLTMVPGVSSAFPEDVYTKCEKIIPARRRAE